MGKLKITYAHVYDTYLGVFAMVVLIFPKFTAMSFLGFLPLILAGFKLKQLFFRLNKMSLLFIVLYVLYAFYVLFTRHQDIANRYLEYKLALIILPIILAFQLKERVDYRRSIFLFILSLCILFISSVFHAIDCHNSTQALSCFFSSKLSFQHHPTYTSVYLIVGISLLVYGYIKKLKFFSLPIVISLISVFMIYMLFCMSLAGILFLGLFIGGSIFYYVLRKFGRKRGVFAGITLVLVIFILFNSVPQIKYEVGVASKPLKEFIHNPVNYTKTQDPNNGSIVRLMMWTASAQVFLQYPLGVGTGNVDEVLMQKVKDLGQPELAELNYNPHNQYLQTGIEVGIWGIFVLLAIVFFAFRKGWQTKNWVLVILAASFAFNMLFESMLQRQEGLVFYVFLFCLLYNDSTRSEFLSLQAKTKD
jgi:O-antigen ligase